jgi:poly(A) polymerase
MRLFKDKDCLEIIEIVFPQFKNLQKFKKLNSYANENLSKIDFIFLLSLMIIDGTDNTDYFFYKFRISKKDQKRLKLIDLFYKDKSDLKKFTEKNFNKIFYYDGKQAVNDIINFKLFTSTKVEKKLIKLMEIYKDKVTPTMPIGSDILMNKYNIPEGKILGNKLKMIEEIWVSNNFNISEKQLKKIVNN